MREQQTRNVGIYVRLSNDDERTGESISIENQKMLLTRYVEERGWSLKNIYCDDGFSGTNQNRPGFQRMLRDVENGIINTIVIKDLSRLGRNYLEVGNLTEEFLPSMGCELISLNEKIDDMMVFRNWFNENHSKETSRKVKAVKKMFAENGKFLGTYAPYGYKKNPENKHHLLIDEKTAPTVKRIFELRSRGKGFRAIACTLNDERITPPRESYYEEKGKSNPLSTNRLWSGCTVRTIIRNEAYIGNMVQFKKGTKSYKTRKVTAKPKEEWVRVENTHDPIISRELWQAVTELDEKKYKPRKCANGRTNLYIGLLKCGDCGHSMKYQSGREKRKDGTVVYYPAYICNNYAMSGKNACTTHTISEKTLNGLVFDSIRSDAALVRKNEESISKMIEARQNNLSVSYQQTYEKELKVHQTRLAKIDCLMQMLYEDRIDGEITDAMFKDLMIKYEKEKASRTEKVRELNKKILRFKKSAGNSSKWASLIEGFASLQQVDSEALLALIERIVVDEPRNENGTRKCGIHIFYKYTGYPEWIVRQGMRLAENETLFCEVQNSVI